MDQYSSRLLKLLVKNILESESDEYMIFSPESPVFFRSIRQILLDILYESTGSYSDLQKHVAALLRHLIQTEKQSNDTDDSLNLRILLAYLTDHLFDATLKSVADHFHFSESAFSKQVKKISGEKFSDLLRRMKLKKATEFLEQTDMSIESIAQYINYSNRYSFERAFLKEYGVLPKEYKENHF